MIFKKPDFWDLKKPNLISYFLLPLTFPIKLNNFLLSLKKKTKTKNVKTICVGNIYLGGTGKTPTTIKLFEILKKQKINVVTAKKITPSLIDEKIILEKKTELFIGSNRKKIINEAILSKRKLVIFDDGLQDKQVKYDIEFVCFDVQNWIGNGNLIPAGPLREKLNSLKKYDGVFLKNNDEKDISKIIEMIKINNPKIEIFLTKVKPLNLEKFNISDNFLVFSGIGNPSNFKQLLLKEKFRIVDEIIFPDHYTYSTKDINFIKEKAKNLNAKIITTEKDYTKISKIDPEGINYLEIDLNIKDEEKLVNFIQNKIDD